MVRFLLARTMHYVVADDTNTPRPDQEIHEMTTPLTRFAALTMTGFAMLSGAMTFAPSEAEACSIFYEEPMLPREYSEDMTYPANGIFLALHGDYWKSWVDEEGEAIELESVDVPGAPSGLNILRAKTPLEPGQVIRAEGCEYEGCELTIGEEDVTAPGAATIGDVEVYLDRKERFRRARIYDSCGGSSGEDHSLTFSLTFDTELEYVSHHALFLYAAPTPEALAALTEPTSIELVQGGYGEQPRFYQYASLIDGGSGFRRNAPFCFTAALMDAAGNVGERSEPVCVDPTDRRAPYVSGPGAGACSTTSGGDPLAPLGALLLGVGLIALRRRQG